MQTDLIIQGLRRWFAEHPEQTEASVGLRAGRSNSTVRKILSGASQNPTIGTLSAIAKVIGLSLEEIAELGSDSLQPSPEQPGFAEPPSYFQDDAALWRSKKLGSAADIIAQIISARCRAPQVWRAHRSQPLIGILAGDLLVIDANATPRDGDTVIATVVDPALADSRTMIRIWVDPFLMPCDADDRLPIRVDAKGHTRIMGVVAGVARLRDEQITA